MVMTIGTVFTDEYDAQILRLPSAQSEERVGGS